LNGRPAFPSIFEASSSEQAAQSHSQVSLILLKPDDARQQKMDPTVNEQSLKSLIPFQACEFSKRKTQQSLCIKWLSDSLTLRYIPTGSDQRQHRHVKDGARGVPPTSNMNSEQMDDIWEGEL